MCHNMCKFNIAFDRGAVFISNAERKKAKGFARKEMPPKRDRGALNLFFWAVREYLADCRNYFAESYLWEDFSPVIRSFITGGFIF